MRRHTQQTGVRNWYGDDLIDLQGEPLKVLDRFFTQYSDFIVSGCNVTGNADGTFDISEGLVALTLEGPDGERTGYVAPFEGARGLAEPRLAVRLKHHEVEREYASGGSKPVYTEWTAVAAAESNTDSSTLTLSTQASRFADALQDQAHKFVSQEQIESWDGKASQADLAAKADKTELAGKADKSALDAKADKTALDAKVDKEEGKGLSTVDFTEEYKNIVHYHNDYDTVISPDYPDTIKMLLSTTPDLQTVLIWPMKDNEEMIQWEWDKAGGTNLNPNLRCVTGRPGNTSVHITDVSIVLRNNPMIAPSGSNIVFRNITFDLCYAKNTGVLRNINGFENCTFTIFNAQSAGSEDYSHFENCRNFRNCKFVFVGVPPRYVERSRLAGCSNFYDCTFTGTLFADGSYITSSFGPEIAGIQHVYNCRFENTTLYNSTDIQGCHFINSLLTTNNYVVNNFIEYTAVPPATYRMFYMNLNVRNNGMVAPVAISANPFKDSYPGTTATGAVAGNTAEGGWNTYWQGL